MPPAEAATRRPAAPVARPVRLTGWGGGPAVPARLAVPADREDLLAAVAAADGAMIARGLGRSYGDAAQLTDGLVLDMTGLGGHALDPETGLVTARAGETIGRLLRSVVPRGWILPVVPGTQHVTVGGAIASDVHGKNHVRAGSFGGHVTALGLLTANGEVLELRPGGADGWFEATIGGMGLTGVILWATIALRPVAGTALDIDSERTSDLGQALGALRAGEAEYRVAWLDLLGPRRVRGIVTCAGHRSDGVAARPAAVPARVAVPARWPGRLLRPSLIRAFNARRFAMAPRRAVSRPGDFAAEMFPLDAVDAWPRLYGPAGLAQYQFAVPTGREEVIEQVIERVRRSRVPCFLAVLKSLGAQSPAPLSFPLAGWTLALDLPRAAPGLGPLAGGLDRLVAEAGGRVYLTKDSLLTADALQAMYPRLPAWRRVQAEMDPDGRWRSDLAVRTGLVAPA